MKLLDKNSPFVGVVAMIAITVILSAVIAIFILAPKCTP
jgi:FlaG/FlaF family flagellin (archaellin)